MGLIDILPWWGWPLFLLPAALGVLTGWMTGPHRYKDKNKGEVGIATLIMLVIGAGIGWALKADQKRRCLKDIDYLPQCEALYYQRATQSGDSNGTVTQEAHEADSILRRSDRRTGAPDIPR